MTSGATSTFGIGADFDERLMEGMARAGGGNFYYLQNAGQIPEFLMSELGEALEVVARDATLVLEQTADRHRVSLAAHELKGERFAAYSRREGKDVMGRRVRV